MGDAVIEEAMMATSLMDDSIMDATYDPYTDMTSFSANLCDVVQDDDMGMYSASEDMETYTNRSKRLICKRCGKAFRNKALLKKHASMHSKELLFECEECFKKFNRKESLTRHMLVHSGMKFFECPECGRMFNQNGHLRTHMLVHTKEKNFECDICNMKFARKDNLRRHSVLHDRKKSYECSTCGKRFNQPGHLEAHLRVHTQERNFECQQCYMKFARRDTLKRHMLVHSKDKTFECDYCSARFIQNSHLKAHILVHTREKKYNCPDCDKKFARKGSLTRHRLVHTGERNFECTECGKSFIQKTHLNKHQLIHNGSREKMSEDRVDEFIENINKVEVNIEQLSPAKSDIKEESSLPSNKSTVEAQIPPGGKKPGSGSVHQASVKNQSHSSKTNSSSKANSVSGNDSSCISKNLPSCKVQNNASSDCSNVQQQQQQQQQNSQPIAMNNMQQCSNVSTKKGNAGNIASATQGGIVNEMQPNNLLANSNSVMALALLDHFLTGNESQGNIVPEPPAKGKAANNQWAQKTQQELLAAQTLSAIGQRAGAVNDNRQQPFRPGDCVNPQVTACNSQPMPLGPLSMGPTSMKIRPPHNPEWMLQERGFMHPQNVMYNVPPPAHEIYRYYSPTNVPLPHPSNNRDMGQYKDASCIPADMRASPRKLKYPQKVVVPGGEWQTLPPGNANLNMPVYAHSKHPSELPRLLDKQ